MSQPSLDEITLLIQEKGQELAHLMGLAAERLTASGRAHAAHLLRSYRAEVVQGSATAVRLLEL